MHNNPRLTLDLPDGLVRSPLGLVPYGRLDAILKDLQLTCLCIFLTQSHSRIWSLHCRLLGQDTSNLLMRHQCYSLCHKACGVCCFHTMHTSQLQMAVQRALDHAADDGVCQSDGPCWRGSLSITLPCVIAKADASPKLLMLSACLVLCERSTVRFLII